MGSITKFPGTTISLYAKAQRGINLVSLPIENLSGIRKVPVLHTLVFDYLIGYFIPATSE